MRRFLNFKLWVQLGSDLDVKDGLKQQRLWQLWKSNRFRTLAVEELLFFSCLFFLFLDSGRLFIIEFPSLASQFFALRF